MRHFLSLTLSLSLACAHAAHDPSAGAPAAEEIRTVIESYDAAWNRRDSTTVAAFLAPDYVYFSSTGRLTSREETLALLTSPEYQLAAAERTELEVTHASPDVAVVSSRWRGNGTWQGEAFRDDQRCGLVLARSSERWQILSEHCTQITEQAQTSP